MDADALVYDGGDLFVFNADSLEMLQVVPDETIDAVITDPPYDLTSGKKGGTGEASAETKTPYGRSRITAGGGFMGQQWDATGIAFEPAIWIECLRVLRPGGHLLSFGGTRTFHRMAVAVEDAGFQIRDSIAWLYGSGFPKSMNVGGGWGTALKPAFEPIIVARKPFKGTVAKNVLEYGTGALNIDACRVEGVRDRTEYGLATATRSKVSTYGDPSESADFDASKGRWPTNVLLDGDMADQLDEQTGMMKGGAHPGRRGADKDRQAYGAFNGQNDLEARRTEGGGGSRFFPTFRYQAKAPAKERPKVDGVAHPTVKPLELMRWLVKLVTPVGGTVLDPFAGSGTTGQAALLEGMTVILCERQPEYIALIMDRLKDFTS